MCVRVYERELQMSQWSELSCPNRQNPSCLHGCECTTGLEVHPEHAGAGSLVVASTVPTYTLSAKWKHNEQHIGHICTKKEKQEKSVLERNNPVFFSALFSLKTTGHMFTCHFLCMCVGPLLSYISMLTC